MSMDDDTKQCKECRSWKATTDAKIVGICRHPKERTGWKTTYAFNCNNYQKCQLSLFE